MKEFKFISITFMIVLCSIVLCSCLSVNRKIILNKDGSGTETLTITFDKQFYGMMSSMTSLMDSTRRQGFLDSLYSDEIFIDKTKSRYDSIPGIKLIDMYSKKGTDSSNSFVINYKFDSVQEIGSSLNQIKENNDSSKTTVTFERIGDDVLFNYLYEKPVKDSLLINDSLTQQMKQGMSALFGTGNISFEIQFPYEVVSSNATSTDGNILTWSFPMSEVIMENKMKLEAVMKND